MSKKQSILIVGAGPGGLGAAMALARDHDVTVVEMKSGPGGRMGKLADGPFAFDTGPTMLQLPSVLDGLFRRAGVERSDYIELMKVEPYAEITFWDGSTLRSTTDQAQMTQAMDHLSPGLGRRFGKWSAEQKRRFDVAYDRFIATEANSVLGYFGPQNTLPAAPFKPWQTMYSHLMEYFDDERMAYGLSYPSKYLGLHPTTCPSVFAVIPYIEYAYGVWHPRGGFRALSEAMAQCAQDLGATFVYDTPVSEILIENGQARGIVTEEGEVILADRVVCNADFGWANENLIDERWRQKYDNKKLRKMKYSCSTFMLYLGLSRRYDDMPHHGIYMSEHVRRTEKRFLNDTSVDLVDPPFYVCNPCVTESSSAPNGKSTLYVLVPVPNHFYPVDWELIGPQMRDVTVKRLTEFGYDDLEGHIEVEHSFTTQTWMEDFHVYQGAVFNLAHTWDQLGPLRPHCQSEDVDRLYWVGGGTHPGSGLLTIFESAHLVANAIQRQSVRERPAAFAAF